MLALLVVTFLIAVGGSLSQENKCVRKESDVCNKMGDFGSEFPQTPEQMDAMCQIAMKRLSCLSDAFKKCDQEESEDASFARSVRLYVETSVCNRESPTYKSLSSNLRCIEESLSRAHGVCGGEKLSRKEERISSELGTFLREGVDETDYAESARLDSCVLLMFKYACVAVALGEHCGEDVRDATLELVLSVDEYLRSCPSNLVAKTPSVVNALESMSEVEEDVEQAIKKRK